MSDETYVWVIYDVRARMYAGHITGLGWLMREGRADATVFASEVEARQIAQRYFASLPYRIEPVLIRPGEQVWGQRH